MSEVGKGALNYPLKFLLFVQISSKLPADSRQAAQALVLYLVQRGADVDIKDRNSSTPLDCVHDTRMRDLIKR